MSVPDPARRRFPLMAALLARRLAQLVPTLFFVSILIFGLQQLLPGDPAMVLAGEDRDPQVIAQIRERYHLDRPIPVQYLYWVGGVLRGDLGQSIRLNEPVSGLLIQKLPVTLQLAFMAMVFALAIGITAGIVSAINRGNVVDYVVSTLSLVGISTPNFWLGIMLIFVFAVSLGWFSGIRLRQPLRGSGPKPSHHESCRPSCWATPSRA